jgi:hypothetical protein
VSQPAPDTERVTVSTYVPAYQRDRWRADADELGMSQSEFVRTMVQAGRSGFELAESGGIGDSETGGDSPNPVEDHPPDVTPGGNGLKNRVLEVLSREAVVDWDDLVAGVTGDIEERLDEALDELQTENRVRYSGRHGGYRLVGDGE